MSRFVIPLEDVRIASPCHADWDMMDGNDHVKLCGSCRKNVYNLSEMTRFDAEELIAEKEGNLCVRYYQRADGTILTQDCPVGFKKLRKAALVPLARLVATGVAAIAAHTLWVFAARTPEEMGGAPGDKGFSLLEVQPLKTITDMVSPAPTPTPPSDAVMGFMVSDPSS